MTIILSYYQFKVQNTTNQNDDRQWSMAMFKRFKVVNRRLQAISLHGHTMEKTTYKHITVRQDSNASSGQYLRLSSMKTVVSLRKASSLEIYAVLIIESYTILFFKGHTDKNLAASGKKVLWTFYQMKHLISMLTSQVCSLAKASF